MNLKALCEEAGVELYDSELVSENGKKIYRIYIMKEGGVSLEDCARLSEILSPIFDVEPPVSGEYFLEVSSAGLERKLSTLEHFEKSVGEMLKITTSEKEKIQGKLLKVEGENIFLQDEKAEICIEFSQVKKAKTFIEW
ncbi:ribosome maturation factor RimP [Campylobacter upsaliensis]|uniref:Ribosome maturation factor RimP n=1 Tax=Campylobacter upsaliensis TaxID=28080 RepID=A0A381EJX8_CAMUP|nr:MULTISPECIES: ribosome maturation factor RimP [Campylobacter]EAH5886317.1 ribosome maturation factor RimP [Campylobacter upsaliensis]EAH9284865.1 ribosome maturation factor RimP [Campylobacter upsaliensis]EAI4325748.1 ribosome maturation factor RimP [Campylobacter upsaliensis]EAI4356980.1 ribosome maturation factor RimP [Campylobacter upsaliensis]EAI5622730.1 ribosome maturation factor RimP [Campylobacter upsaliensis]